MKQRPHKNRRKPHTGFEIRFQNDICSEYTYDPKNVKIQQFSFCIFPARSHDGSRIIFDDFREAYWWLRMNTPENAKVMSWWDY